MLTALQPQPLASGSIVLGRSAPGQAFLTASNIGLPLKVVSFNIDRFANRIGTWAAVVIGDDALSTDGVPYATLLKRGSRVTIRQENNGPFGATTGALLTDGTVDRREFQPVDGGLLISLTGSFKEQYLASTEIHDKLSYPAGTPIESMAEAFGATVTFPTISNTTAEVDFNSGSYYQSLLIVGDLGRLTLRENWDADHLEFVAIDNAPDSGWEFTNIIEQAGPELYGDLL